MPNINLNRVAEILGQARATMNRSGLYDYLGDVSSSSHWENTMVNMNRRYPSVLNQEDTLQRLTDEAATRYMYYKQFGTNGSNGPRDSRYVSDAFLHRDTETQPHQIAVTHPANADPNSIGTVAPLPATTRYNASLFEQDRDALNSIFW